MSEDNQIVFKDFKNSVTKKEFKTILTLAKEEYSTVAQLLKRTSDFEADSLKKLRTEFSELEDSQRLMERITINLANRAKEHLMDSFGEKIKRSKEITDFINRFQVPGEEYPELNIDFLKDKK